MARGAPVRLRLGTRGSRLALVQSEIVARQLRAGGHQVETVQIVTEGDLRPVGMSPGEGVFVAAIARALAAGEIDIAVHSAKDVPLEDDPGLVIAAYPERGDPRDALVTRDSGQEVRNLPRGARVGTDSPRRTGFLRAARMDLEVVPLHGNVDTRLRRLDEGEVDALVLAAAGLDRLGLGERIDQRIEPELMAPAPAQGALAIQVRAADRELREGLSALDDPGVRVSVRAERAVLEATGGTCRAPVGVLATPVAGRLRILVMGVNSDGSDRHLEWLEVPFAESEEAARAAGRRLAAEVALR